MRIASLTLAMAVLASCAAPSPKEKEHTQLQLEARYTRDEVELGREMSAKLLGSFGVYEKEQPVHYVNLVGKYLADRWGRSDISYHFAILDSQEVNAYAAPGGYIFVTRGLLTRLQTETELALILAHEITHVNERHTLNEIAPRREVYAGETITRMMSRGGTDIGGSIVQIANKGLGLLLETGLGKAKELEADEGAVHIAASAGYAAGAYPALLQRLEKEAATLKAIEISLPFPERIAAVRKLVSAHRFSDKTHADEKVLAARFRRSVAMHFGSR